MKKNWVLRLGVAVLMMSVITLSLVSGTFAKYTKGFTDNETVRAANFQFNLFDGTNTTTEQSGSATFNIFNYTDAGVYNNNGVNGTDEFIAPGTTGAFALQVGNLSEVDVGVTFALAETNAGDIPVYYTVGAADQRYSSVLTGDYTGGGTYQNLTAMATALAGSTLQASDGTTPTNATYTINWFWSFDSAGTEQSDAGDTAIGIAASLPTIDLAVTATVTQVD